MQNTLSLTPPEHEWSEAVTLGARRLVEVPVHQRGNAPVPWLRGQYPMTTIEAIQAIRLANLIRSGGVDDGSA